ncbi:hypothetical protein QEH56_10520 [Pelagicoccus enzymogenes]|uniref:hypothetical protein n=1 Tax=Pelagicoccus enzymogenes TaxID=2773457 RepID=UPI00280D5AD7|nr:hypothetical protein [Pelagicoccus enzymogenes]MDQ8198585.1 hypothetical protein [Pelagicoccus enzymogenes]
MCVRILPKAVLCALILLSNSVSAQESEDDEVFELSPFQVSSDHGYRARRTTKTVPEVTVNDIGATIDGVNGPFDPSLKRAHGVTVAFAYGFYDDQELVRRETLNRYIDEVRKVLATHESFYFEPKELLVPEGDRKRGRNSRRSAYTSYAHFDVSFEFGDGASPFEKVLEIRKIVSAIGIQNDVTKLFYGGASLVAQKYRDTLLFGVGERYEGISRVDELGSSVPYVTDAIGRQLRMADPSVAVTLVKPADAVRIEFSLEVENLSEVERARSIEEALKTAQGAVESVQGLEFESGTVRLSKGEGVQGPSTRLSSYYAQALFSVRIPIGEGSFDLERVREVRQLLFEQDWAEAELRFGAAALVVNNVDRYRSELLAAVFADLKAMDAGLGDLFEVVPSIENVRIQLRQASPTEVELWIPYSYKVVSVREREHQKDLFELELEKARAATAAALRETSKG